ncbi:MAG: hypothetical protein ACLQU3_20910 [Limisphaerales bacterium]
MKKQILRIAFACAAAVVFAGCASTSAPSTSPTTDASWQKVAVTRNAEDVNGMTRVADVSASARMVFGSPESLRTKATVKLQQEAATKGATVVLIQGDDFQATLINNVNLLGIAYK